MREFTTIQLLQLIREAKRDALISKYGEKWREHETWGTFWEDKPESQFEIDALEMNRALLGGYSDEEYPMLIREKFKIEQLKLPPCED